ncbi:Sorting nexin-24 [Armadillidium nasatum]|uniref:Sorting nexin-24 n=1 Tax=Armadillidium nasatum TaxID=96803 RepID=A0A5N5SR69_9CRUS|nr:Sorting nexin-24 [Armadillidium nasatum]
MIRAYIPKYKLVEQDGGRNYYVYALEISYAGKLSKIEKRYSAFHRLYKEVEKSYITGYFPPKRIRNTSHKVLELRRTGLEAWLQLVLKIQPIPNSLISFLEVSNYQHPVDTGSAELEPKEELSHQSLLVFPKDPYLSPDSQPECYSIERYCSVNTPLADTITKGVLVALYDSSFMVDVS